MKKISMMFCLLCALYSISSSGASVLWDAVALSRQDDVFWVADDDAKGWLLETDVEVVAGGWVTMRLLFTTESTNVGMLVANPAIDMGYEKYVSRVSEGDLINAESARFPDRLFETNHWPYEGEKHDFAVDYDGIFTLGFEIAYEADNQLGTYSYIYGWATLQFDNENLSLVSSAVAIDSEGIYAGTGNIVPRAIPEPSTTALMLIGLVAVGACRRRA